MVKGDKFWLNDPKVLITNKNYLAFVPTTEMDNVEILNALTRLAIYFTILLLLFASWNSYYFFLPMLIIFGTIAVHKVDISVIDIPIIAQDKCTKPTQNNPFMNVGIYDKRDRLEACEHEDNDIKKQVNKGFYDNAYVNVDDIYENRNSQRQFYTMPVSTIPNDQDAFAKWCYLMPEADGCKTNQGSCLRYEDVRYKQSSL